MPKEGYEKTIQQIDQQVKQIDLHKKNMERDRDHTHSREYKAQKKECARLQDLAAKLKDEQQCHVLNHTRVLARLEQEKSKWFLKPSPHSTAAFVADMICPRVLTSQSDALFCCKFVKLLISLKTPGFQLLDFYNSWTIMLTQCIRCCSEREAQIFGVFLREMMSYVLHLRKDEKTYNEESKGNPCFHRNYYEDPNAAHVEFAKFGDFQKGHAKWEGRIHKALKYGLDSEDWMEKRNALLLLSQSCEAFPVVEKYGKLVLSSIESMKDKAEWSDIKTLAGSLAIKLKNQREHWVDKQAPPPASERRTNGDDGKDGNRGSGRSKNAL